MSINKHFLEFLVQETMFRDKEGKVNNRDLLTLNKMQKDVIDYANEVYRACEKTNLSLGVIKPRPRLVREYTRECKFCGNTFKTEQPQKMYCSDVCRNKAYAMRNYTGSHTLFDQKIELSTRAYSCLMRAGIKTVEELIAHSERELLNLRNVGYGTVIEIRKALKEHGLELKEGEE